MNHSINQSVYNKLLFLIWSIADDCRRDVYVRVTKIAIAILLKEQEIEKLKEYKMSLIDGIVTGNIKLN